MLLVLVFDVFVVVHWCGFVHVVLVFESVLVMCARVIKFVDFGFVYFCVCFGGFLLCVVLFLFE